MSRSYLSELQDVTLRLDEAERRLTRAIETPPPSRLSSAGVDNTLQIAEQEVSLSSLCWGKTGTTPVNVETGCPSCEGKVDKMSV